MKKLLMIVAVIAGAFCLVVVAIMVGCEAAMKEWEHPA